MSYKIEKLPNQPVILTTIFSDGQWISDLARSDIEAKRLLEKSREPLFVIVDMSSLVFSLEEVIMGASRGARNQRVIGHRANLREMLIVSNSSLVKFASKGLDTPVFGYLNAGIFASVDDALAHVHSQVAVKTRNTL